MPACLILSTASSRREARKIAEFLLHHRLAACVTLLPHVESHFSWKGRKESTQECMLLIKTERKCYARIEKAIQKSHSYEVPEIVALPITQGSRKYLAWISQALGVI